MTVAAAIRTLAGQGFVRTQAGSGTYVRDEASLPVPDDADQPLAGVAAWGYEMGYLKHLPRTGWQLLGIPQPESVAEHSFRAAAIAIVLAALEGADPGRAAALAVLHDAAETRIGDVPSVGRAYVTTAAAEAVAAHQTAAMPDGPAKVVRDLVAEFEAAETPEAKVAKDADKLELLMQAVEYQQQGFDTTGWQDSAAGALRTDSGRQLARTIAAADPHDWFAAFQASYAELRGLGRGGKQRPSAR